MLLSADFGFGSFGLDSQPVHAEFKCGAFKDDSSVFPHPAKLTV